MFQAFGEKEQVAADEAKRFFARLADGRGWAPIGGDVPQASYVLGLLQDAGIFPVTDCRGMPRPTIATVGPIAFCATSDDAPQPRFKDGVSVRLVRDAGGLTAGTLGKIRGPSTKKLGHFQVTDPNYLGTTRDVPADALEIVEG